jgi:hypothetical protein
MDLNRSGIFALALVAVAVHAQEPGSSDEYIAPQQSLKEQDASAKDPADTASGIDDIDPAVSTSVLTADSGPGVSGSGVMDEMSLSRTEIIGNQELPKVMYIVPWKKSDPGEITGKPVNTLLDEVLAPVDRGEFLRQVDYYGDLYGETEQ